MLTIKNSLRLVLAMACVMGMTITLSAQTKKTKKERKEKTPRVKKTKPARPTASIPISNNGYNDDVKRFIQNFNNEHKSARDLANDYRLSRVLMEDQINDLEAVVKLAIAKIGGFHSIKKVDDVIEIMNYGVMSTPALVIDGVVKSTGKVLSVDEVLEIMNEKA